ncbi:MAG: hypothetical protein CMM94_01085 [Rickettsiales bacterium]|nr:hypothetical protein [Rickettsiales bacterium]
MACLAERIAQLEQTQLSWLNRKTQRAVNELEQAAGELHSLEAELDNFLLDYYDKVGSYIEQLHELEEELSVYVQREEALCENGWQLSLDVAERKASSGDLKKLYRELARRYHPDCQPNQRPEQADIIKQINNAYARKDIAALWRIKLQSDQQIEDERSALMTQLECAQHALKDIEARRARLEKSPAYALMRRSFEARLCGRDLVQTVVNSVSAQIEETRRKLVATKIRHHYMEPAGAAVA